MKLSRKFGSEGGFTLIELMVAVSIIALLAAVTYPSLESSKAKSRDAIRAGDLEALGQTAETIFSEKYSFPKSATDFSVSNTDFGPYFGTGQVPKDPTNGKMYYYKQLKVVPDGKNGFCLGAVMEIISNDVKCGLESIPGVNYQVTGP